MKISSARVENKGRQGRLTDRFFLVGTRATPKLSKLARSSLDSVDPLNAETAQHSGATVQLPFFCDVHNVPATECKFGATHV